MNDPILHRTKRLLLLLLLTAAAGCLIAQEESVDLNLLRAPVSPAATLLGTSESQVEKPSDPSAFMVSLMQATDRFSAFPLNYAVDLAPVWLFHGDEITIQDYLDPAIDHSLPQSFVISLAAANNVDSTGNELPRLAAGMKTSILRGKVSDGTVQQLDRLHELLASSVIRFDKLYDSLLIHHPRHGTLDSLNRAILADRSLDASTKKQLTAPLLVAMQQIESDLEQQAREVLSNEEEELRTAISDLRIERFGAKLDLSFSASWDFPGGRIGNGGLSQIALWLSGGWEDPKGISLLGVLKYQYFDQIFVVSEGQVSMPGYYEQVHSLDGGIRLIYSYKKFMISGEALGRQYLSRTADIKQGWRGTLNASYEVGMNKKLGITVGRDFNQQTYYEQENLILGLNLLLGFGTKKSL